MRRAIPHFGGKVHKGSIPYDPHSSQNPQAPMSNHKFAPFTDKTLAATEKVWLKAAESGLTFPTEAEQVIAYVRGHMTEQHEGDSVAYGIFPKGSDVADGVAEVALTRRSARSKWVKLLRVRLNPIVEEQLMTGTPDATSVALDVFVSAVKGVSALTRDHSANTLKIYGRSAKQLQFLKTLGVELKKLKVKANIKVEGRWLVIENVAQIV